MTTKLEQLVSKTSRNWVFRDKVYAHGALIAIAQERLRLDGHRYMAGDIVPQPTGPGGYRGRFRCALHRKRLTNFKVQTLPEATEQPVVKKAASKKKATAKPKGD